MNLNDLRDGIRSLAVMGETGAPFLSCYVDVEGGARSYRRALDKRVFYLRGSLPPHQRKDFEIALGQVETYLGAHLLPSSKGAALYARAGEYPFFRALQLQLPVPNWLSVDVVPNIYQLMELKDRYHRYIVLIATEDHARILEVDLGEVTRELWASRPELRTRVGQVWTREHYQNHRSERGAKFLKEKIKLLDQLFTGGRYSHLILAGDSRITSAIREKLPRRLAHKLVDVVAASPEDGVSDVVSATLSTFVEYEQQESLETTGLLLEELRHGGLATADTEATLEALQRGQVDVLVMAAAYESPPGWVCRTCGTAGQAYKQPAACPECGDRSLREANLKAEMARLAELHGVEVEILFNSDALLDLGGVGCLLRYLTPEQPARRIGLGQVAPDELRVGVAS